MVSLALDPPPSSRREGPHRGRAATAFSVALLVALGAGFWLGRATAPKAPRSVSASEPATPTSAHPERSAAAGGAESKGTATATATPTATPTATAIPTATEIPGVHRLVVTVNGPLEDSIASALPAEERRNAEELTAVVNRLLVWDLQVARDGRRGDKLDVLWTPPSAVAPGVPVSGEPVVLALRYASSKLGTVLAAYRYEPKGARWPRYYRADGHEVEARLVDPPVAEYEQITSLLRDGRRHKGVDFKAPVGSPVTAPFDGVIARRNWHFAANGNCLDVRDASTGRHAIFLHLDAVPKEMQPGRKVRKGDVIASTGNSGRSFAPHLHYQLEDASGRVLDPFEVLRTERRAVPAGEKAEFEAARAKLDAAF
jgi:murein DD-endopeptidase MepM/ murein hydrolase activator NlpD